MEKRPVLSIVIPCYYEEEMLPKTISVLEPKLKSLIEKFHLSEKSHILFVDDGSLDRTWELIQKAGKDSHFKGIKLSGNRGHQHALTAGLLTAKDIADFAISADADLQDDINVMDKFIEEHFKGNQIVYGVRKSRTVDTKFKKFTAQGFYKIMKTLGVNLIYNHADYRLVSKKVLENFADIKEVNLFLRGVFPYMGFKSSIVEYDRQEREFGETKYPLRKMLSFAWEGITSFSSFPLRAITLIGIGATVISFLLLAWALIQTLRGQTVPGWSSTIVSIYFLGAIQLICLGVIGEYLTKIFQEVKARPRFFIEESSNL